MARSESRTDGPNVDAVPRLALMRYRLRFHSRSGALPPGFLGSAWRGAFGHALRRTVCITGLPPSCDGCALLASCVYPRTFESRPPADAKKLKLYPTAPNPYVLEPAGDGDAKKDALHLGLTLFGPANDDAPTALQALQRAGRDGLTNARMVLDFVDAQAESVGADGELWTLVQNADAGMEIVSAQEPRVPPAPPAVRVQLLSPLRIRGDGRYVGPSEFNFRTFAANLLRRFSLLTYFFGQAPLEVNFAGLLREAEGVPLEDVQLRWREISRRSSRQRATIQMGGLVGAFTVRAPQLAFVLALPVARPMDAHRQGMHDGAWPVCAGTAGRSWQPTLARSQAAVTPDDSHPDAYLHRILVEGRSAITTPWRQRSEPSAL